MVLMADPFVINRSFAFSTSPRLSIVIPRLFQKELYRRKEGFIDSLVNIKRSFPYDGFCEIISFDLKKKNH